LQQDFKLALVAVSPEASSGNVQIIDLFVMN